MADTERGQFLDVKVTYGPGAGVDLSVFEQDGTTNTRAFEAQLFALLVHDGDQDREPGGTGTVFGSLDTHGDVRVYKAGRRIKIADALNAAADGLAKVLLEAVGRNAA